MSATLAGSNQEDGVEALARSLGGGPSARCSKRRAFVDFSWSVLAPGPGSSNSDGGGSDCGPAGLCATSICPSGGACVGAFSAFGRLFGALPPPGGQTPATKSQWGTSRSGTRRRAFRPRSAHPKTPTRKTTVVDIAGAYAFFLERSWQDKGPNCNTNPGMGPSEVEAT